MKLTKQQLKQIIKEELEENWPASEKMGTTLPEMVVTLDEASDGIARFMGLAPGEGEGDQGTLVRAHKLVVGIAERLRMHPAYEENQL